MTFRKRRASALAAMLVAPLHTLSAQDIAPRAVMPPALAATTPETPVERVQLPIDALMQDAARYAARYGVTLDAAMHRMRAQSETVPVTDALRETYRDRWVGIAVDHDPDYRIVILLTGDDPVPDQSIAAGGLTIPVLFRTGYGATRDRILSAITQHQVDIRAMLPHPPGIGLDQRTGEMVVMIAAADAVRAERDGMRDRIAAMTRVPVRIEPVDRPPLDMAVEGGARVVGRVDGVRYACTTGFVVSDGTRTGIVTAAHCPDTLSYVERGRDEVPLAFVGQWGWGYQDVQVNVAPGPLAPLFFADTARTVARPVVTWRYRDSTRAGDFVCHRGERTGYSCAEVRFPDFAPPGDLCYGNCPATWVAVAGPSCRSGDSGGPVFLGGIAFGLTKGGSYVGDGACRLYYYMSVDYLPPPWRVMVRGDAVRRVDAATK